MSKKLPVETRSFSLTFAGSLTELGQNEQLSVKPVFPTTDTIKYPAVGSSDGIHVGDPKKGVVIRLTLKGVHSTFPVPLLLTVRGLGETVEMGDHFSETGNQRGSFIVHPEQTGLRKDVELLKIDPEHSLKLIKSSSMAIDVEQIRGAVRPVTIDTQEMGIFFVPDTSPIIALLKDNLDKKHEGRSIKTYLRAGKGAKSDNLSGYTLPKSLVDLALKTLAKKQNPNNIKTFNLEELQLKISRQDADEFNAPIPVYQGMKEVGDRVLSTYASFFAEVEVVYRLMDVPSASSSSSSSIPNGDDTDPDSSEQSTDTDQSEPSDDESKSDGSVTDNSSESESSGTD